MGVDITGRSPSSMAGKYFQTSWWCWRPMYAIINQVSDKYGLDIDTELYSSNDGGGIDNEEDSQLLAHSIEEWLLENGCEDDDVIYLSLGIWRKAHGNGHVEDKPENGLGRYLGDIMFSGVVGPDGEILYPLHSIDVKQVREFVEFLKNCGGFEIW